jgi:GMP synthase (glutamine-hydrolysing)
MKSVLVLQHAGCEGLGILANELAGFDFNIRTVRGDLGESIPLRLDDTAALVVMGGPMSVYEQARYPFLGDEIRLVESAVSDQIPILGICLGSQILATALGAAVRPGLRKEIGWYPVYVEPAASGDLLFGEAPRQFGGFHWHGDVFDPPEGATRLARSDLTDCQAFRYQKAYGILFHMEVTKDSLAGMADAFPEALAQAGISKTSLASQADRHLTPLQSIGSKAFAQWVAAIDNAHS